MLLLLLFSLFTPVVLNWDEINLELLLIKKTGIFMPQKFKNLFQYTQN